MILILDVGGTKTEWRLLTEDHKIEQGQGDGFNPLIQESSELVVIVEQLRQSIKGNLKEVYYYGTGCFDGHIAEKIKSIIFDSFPEASVEVNSDLLAAARALCGADKGIACILGTGSNSCVYDGSIITDHFPPLGFILGDEGSGAYMGKELLKMYARGDLSDHLEASFFKRSGIEKVQVPYSLATQQAPNRFLASHTKFLLHHKRDPIIYQLILKSFTAFASLLLHYYDEPARYRIHFTGSVAFYFNDILRKVLNDHGLSVGNIVESPIAGLALFHQGDI